MMEVSRKIQAYISRNKQWEEALTSIREIIRSSSLQETVKWGMPAYTFEGKNIAGMGAFKAYVAIRFLQGVLLKDSKKKMINAQEVSRKAMRQWHFDSVKAIQENAPVIRKYIEEAVRNQEQGREIKPDKNKPLVIPDELR